MEMGDYSETIDFNQFFVRKFTPHLYVNLGYYGCGANTLSLLTGAEPWKVPVACKKQPDHWPDKFMVDFLKLRGFKVARVSKCSVTNLNSDCIENPISDNHVVMMSQLFKKKEASWVVVHNRFLYHNFEIQRTDGLDCLNHPVLSAYLVCHKSWRCDLK